MNKNAIFAIVFALVLASISAFMPVATNDIASILTFHFQEQHNIDNLDTLIYIRPTFYVVIFILTTYFGYKWESSNRKANDEKQKKLDGMLATHAAKLTEQNKKSELVIEFLQTMPPKNFLSHFENTFSFINLLRYRITEITSTPPKNNDLKKTVTSICQANIRAMNILLSELTGLWDSQGDGELPDVQYGVSIMFFFDKDEAFEKFKSCEFSWGDSQMFFLATIPEGIITDVDGVLFTDPNLSTKAINSDLKAVISNLKSELKNKAPKIPHYQDSKPFGLPVTLVDGKCRNQNIPGAPRAFALNKPQYISCCIDEMSREVELMHDIPSSMKDNIKDYYKKHKTVQSIISFPLTTPDGNAYGVVNVSRSKKHLAKRNESDFIALTNPIINLISDSIYTLAVYQLAHTPDNVEV